MVVTVLLDSRRKHVFVEIVNFGQIRSALGSSVEQRNNQCSATQGRNIVGIQGNTHWECVQSRINLPRAMCWVRKILCIFVQFMMAPKRGRSKINSVPPNLEFTQNHTDPVSNMWQQLLSRDRCKVERLNTLSLDLTLKSPSCISPETCAGAMTGGVSSFVLDNSGSRNMW